MNNLLNDLLANIESYYDNLVIVLPKVLLASLIFSFFYFLANRSRNFVNARLTRSMDDPLLATFLSRVVKITIVLIAFLFALQILGLAGVATGIVTGASVSAIVIGFAFKDIGENFLAGIMLAFNRPFQVGDLVELDGYKGIVIALNLRNSRIKTFDGKDIFIPNADVVKNPVINYTMDGYLRHEFTVSLEYGADLSEAIKVILTTMSEIPGILKEKKQTSVWASKLSPNALELTVYYWLDTFDKSIDAGAIRIQSVQQTLAALNTAGFYRPGNVLELKNYGTGSLKTN